jgi:hypothetical protein
MSIKLGPLGIHIFTVAYVFGDLLDYDDTRWS